MSENEAEFRLNPESLRRLSHLDDSLVTIDDSNRVTVEFRVQDLVRRLLPEGDIASSCGGCNGCSGCSM